MLKTRASIAAAIGTFAVLYLRAGVVYAAGGAKVPGITPDSKAPGANGLKDAINAFAFYALLACAAGFVVSVAAWAVGGNMGNDHAASRGKIGAFVALGAAFLLGAATVLLQFAYDTGASS